MFYLDRYDIPGNVGTDVIAYLRESLPKYEVVNILRASDHPDDNDLYHIIARHKTTGEWACWTCWNETTKSLNYGHYNLESRLEAEDISREYYYKCERRS